MIQGFGNKGTEDVYNGNNTKEARKTLDVVLWPIAQRKLTMIDAAVDVLDLRSPPGNRLERLKGKLAGKFSIRINDQWRIVFTFTNGNASEVEITDYH